MATVYLARDLRHDRPVAAKVLYASDDRRPAARGPDGTMRLRGLPSLVTCSTIIPPANMASYGFNTTCTNSKPTGVAGIEIPAKAERGHCPAGPAPTGG